MTIHPAIGPNRYCGPGALAILTGITTDVAATRLRDITGKRAIMRLQPSALLQALADMGYRTTAITPATRSKSLEAFGGSVIDAGVYLLHITGHFAVVHKRCLDEALVCDNLTIYPVPVTRYRLRGRHVKQAWRVEVTA